MMEYATDEKDRDYWEEHEWSCFKAGKNEAMSEVKKVLEKYHIDACIDSETKSRLEDIAQDLNIKLYKDGDKND